VAFDPQTALRLIRYAWDAYYAYWTDAELTVGYGNLDGTWQQAYSQQAWLDRNGYRLIINPDGADRSTKYFGIAGTTADAVIVAFRGTATYNDFAIDALGGGVGDGGRISFPFATWALGSSAVWAHASFLDTYRGLQACVRSLVRALFDGNPALTKLYVTGHSLGGALATLAALDLATTFADRPRVPRPRLWTYASPLVGDQRLAAAVNAATLESYRISQVSDWVTGVPTRGWTPAWLDWWKGGQHGPEPRPKFAPYAHAGDPVPVDTQAWFPGSHKLPSYYLGTQQLLAAAGNPQLRPHDAITSLVVRIKTRNSLGGGTDNDVFIRLLGVSWGALDNPGNDFEAGSVGTYDLFAMFPARIPPNPRVADLTSLGLHLGDGVFYFSVWTMAWDPEWVEITVNGIVFTTVRFSSGTLTWSSSRDVVVPISVAP
jgi:hypothetical protein